MRSLVWIVAVSAGMACVARDVEVRVRTVDGSPRICVDGKPVPPRMFWGCRGSSPSRLSSEWTPFDLTFTPREDVACGTAHIRFNKIEGGITQLRNFRLTEAGTNRIAESANVFGSPEAFRSVWQIWPPKNAYVVTFSNNVCSIEMHPSRMDGKTDPDYHFYSVFWKFRKGVTYSIHYEARGEKGCAMLLPGLYSVSPSGVHSGVPVDSLDTLTRTVRKAAAAGVDFVSYGVPSAWAKGGDDYSGIDDVTESVIRANPNALLIPRVSVNAPDWWLEQNPDHRMQFAAEHADITGRHVWSRGLRPKMAAVSSRLYQKAATDYIVRVARHLQERFPANFAGIHPTGQNTCEWFYFDSWNKMNGYDPQTRDAFRSYLGDPSAEVPPCALRMEGADKRALLDPATQSRCLAFNRFQQLEMTDFIAGLARACRAATNGRKLVVLFYGYAYEFASHTYGPANSGHYGVENLLAKADGALDIMCSPISYHDRAWCGSAPNMSAGETVMRNGVLWLNEDDSRTHLDHRAEAYVQEGTRVTLEQSRNVMLRNTAQEAIRGFGSWWMDLPGWGWYDAKELWDVQKALMPFERAMCVRKRPFEPELALVQDEESMLHVAAHSARLCSRLLTLGRGAVNRSGVPHGQYLLYDALAKPLSAKVVVYQSCWCLSDAEVVRLGALAASRPDQVRVWCWAPGAWREDGTETLKRMSCLTGFKMARHDLASDPLARAKATEAGVAHGLVPDAWYGAPERVNPLFTVTDAQPDEVWARYANGDPAIAVRGNEVFVGVPEVSTELVWALARKAGAHSYLPRGEIGLATLWADAASGALSLQAMTNATLHLQIPAPAATVRDALTDRELGKGPVLALPVKQGESRVLTWR